MPSYKSPEEQLQEYNEALAEAKAAPVDDSPTDWVVAMDWFTKFKDYIGLNEDAIGAIKPFAIDNDDLVTCENPTQMKEGAMKDVDYAVVPEQVFNFLVEVYSLSITTPLFIYEAGAAIFMADLDFKVYACEDNGKPSKDSYAITLKPTNSMEEVCKEAAETAKKEHEKWDWDDDEGHVNLKLWARPAVGTPDEEDDVWKLIPITDEEVAKFKLGGGGSGAAYRYFRQEWAGPLPELMIESRKSGFWRREDAVKMAAVDSMKKLQTAVEAMDDATWRAQLTVGGYCDHKEEKEDGKGKWREAEVISDDQEKLTINYRGLREHHIVVDRASSDLVLPYSKVRDWRNQLRTNTKIDVHREHHHDEVIRARSPVYISENSQHVIYRDVATKNWWVADKSEFDKHKTDCIGYFHIDCKSATPLDIKKDAAAMEKPVIWQVWIDGGWLNETDFEITPCEDARDHPNHAGIPDKITLGGHSAGKAVHAKMMGDYHWEPKLDYFKATCKRIDRKHGEIDVAVSTTSRTSTYYSWTVDHITQDVPLYGNGICDTGTYVKKTGGSTSEWQKSSGTSSGTEGQVGLKNLGNTCFMNSMLQCLNAATPLKDFFLTKQYETEINTKNALGTGGRLATAYGELVEQMWSGDYASVGPTDFKQVLGEVAPQFAGYQQQDSMELFDFLIDNLHEDCNRVIVKPSVPAVEDSGKEDDLMANESWEAYLKRNNSKFTDTMMGQFRSHLTCPKEECKNEARKFDEYMSVPLPIPGEQQKELQVTLYRNKAGSEGVNFEFKVPKGCNWAEAMDIFCTKAGLDIDNIACYEHYNGKILKTMHTPQMKKEDYEKCKPTNYDKFRVYELFTAATPAPVEVADAAPKETNNSDSDDSMHTTTRSYNHNSGIVHGVGTLYNVLQIRFGYENDERYSNHHLGKYRPLMVPMPHGATNAQVLEIVEQHIAEYGGSGVKPVETPPAYEEGAESEEAAPEPGSIAEGLDDGNEDEGNSEDPARANAENAAEPEAYPKFFVLDKITVKAAEVGPYNYSATAVKNYVSIGAPDEVWDYKDSFGVCVIYPSLALFDHEKLNRTEDYVEPVVESGEGEEEDEFSLKKRLQAFSLPEQLGEMDTWYCGKCKDHVQAMKKMDLWSVPDLLTFQLKRFIYEQTNYMYGGPRTLREKIDTLVDFPQEIDMRSFVLGPQKEQEEPLMYRLYGVSNHMGGLGGGHYTAYGLHGDQWLEFNDSSVSKVEPSTVVSGDAYVLFYRRFDPVAEAEQASEAADAAADGMAPGRRSSGASELARPASAAGAASPAKEDAVDEALEAA